MRVVVGITCLCIAACGGDSGEPLLSGSVTGDYRGDPFTAEFGFATILDGDPVIGIGDGPLSCGSVDDNAPPDGTNAILFVPNLDVGSYANVFVDLFHNEGEFSGHGSNTGSVTITESTPDVVAGTVSWTDTDDEAQTYSVNGAFAVVRCAP